MNFTCTECNDTGSRDKSGDYLDCGNCDAAMQRAAMNDFLDKLPAMGDYDAAWLVHQRALAMAPKQEAPTQQPVAWMVGLEVFDTLTEAKLNIRNPELTPEPLYRTPAAANAALMDEQIQEAVNKAVKRGELSWNDYRKDLDGKYTIPNLAPYHFQFARAILAAAGPDAAPVKALEGSLDVIDDYLAYTHDGDPWKEDARAMGEMDINDADNDGRIESWRAALSGAKGN